MDQAKILFAAATLVLCGFIFGFWLGRTTCGKRMVLTGDDYEKEVYFLKGRCFSHDRRQVFPMDGNGHCNYRVGVGR